MRTLDLPPVWLAVFLLASWAIATLLPGLTLDAVWLRWLGAAVILAGAVLMLSAIFRMHRQRTTVIPHRQPSALVTGGVFRFSRNPIYLADAMILTGAILWWGAVLALPLVAVFVRLIGRRFIAEEEAGLRAGFGADFARWSEKTRRWL